MTGHDPADGAVLVVGANAVGAWLGARLLQAGADVQFVAPGPVLHLLRTHGLSLSDGEEVLAQIAPADLQLHAVVPAHSAPSLVLLCVDRGDTVAAATELGVRLPPGTLVVSIQNSFSSAALARSAAPRLKVVPGMVSFGVTATAPGQLRGVAWGQFASHDLPELRTWAPAFEAAGLSLVLHEDLAAVQWGKLLPNLNNAVNALSGLPLRGQLLDHDLRCCTAALMDEALTLLRRAAIEPAAVTKTPPRRLPWLLRLPTPVFRLLAGGLLGVDAHARSSMADALMQGRPTEVDAIHGEVLRLAHSVGAYAPLNARIAELVRAWPQRRRPYEGWELRQQLGL